MSKTFPNLQPYPGQAVELIPSREVGSRVQIPNTNVELTYTKYSSDTSVAAALGDFMCEETTQSGDKNDLDATMKAACTDGSRVSKTNFIGVAVNTAAASTGGFGWTATGSIAQLNDALGTTIKVQLATSAAAGTLLKTSTADHNFRAVSTGVDIATAVGKVDIATGATDETENVTIFKRYGN